VGHKSDQLHLLPIVLYLRLADVHADGFGNLYDSKDACSLRVEGTNESVLMVKQNFLERIGAIEGLVDLYLSEEVVAVRGVYPLNFVVGQLFLEDGVELLVLDDLILEFDDSADEGSQVETLEVAFELSEEDALAVLVLDAHAVHVHDFLPYVLFQVEDVDGGSNVGLHLLVLLRKAALHVLADDAPVYLRTHLLVCGLTVGVNLELGVLVFLKAREIADEEVVVFGLGHEQTAFAQAQGPYL
jgi:hypothetical protein